jgi:cell division protein FtsI (penicillin-binding protein 3)
VDRNRSLSRARFRVTLLALLSTLWVSALVGRLVYLQVFLRQSLQERAEIQQSHTVKLDPERGTIYDRNGRELAVSVNVESVYAVPRTIKETDRTARALADCLPVDSKELAIRLRSDKSFLWVDRKVDLVTADCVRELDLAGVNFVPERRRFYPKRQLAAHVLGYVGMDNEGMSGVEYAFEEEIRGEDGRQITWTDARNRPAASRVEKRPQPGRSLLLTIDETLQHIAQTELEEAVGESGSKGGVAILLRPETGEILAMAEVPGFNPNRYGDYPPSYWRNRSVTDAYEPGSTFKIISAAAALEEGVVSEDERIDCGQGVIQVGNRLIHDHREFDVLTFREVLVKSSNVGMIRIGQRLGAERLARYVRAFGFGEVTGVGLAAESRGILREVSEWRAMTLASISFGQEIAVTPLQMVAAVNTVAAAGYLMRPTLVKEIRSPSNETLRGASPAPVRRVISRETARRLTELMVGVVEEGTGTRGRVPGFTVAGKTGTAQKATPGGGYSKTDYIASFVGFAPAGAPELTALVVLDSPVGDHSGGRAAGVFARIVERSLRHLGVPPDAPDLEDGEATRTFTMASRWPRQEPLDPRYNEVSPPSSPVALVAFGPRVAVPLPMPSLTGLPARDAVARLIAAHLSPELVGSGWVVDQHPPAGAPVDPGSRCLVFLGDTPP